MRAEEGKKRVKPVKTAKKRLLLCDLSSRLVEKYG
jgi:hypothetical protein